MSGVAACEATRKPLRATAASIPWTARPKIRPPRALAIGLAREPPVGGTWRRRDTAEVPLVVEAHGGATRPERPKRRFDRSLRVQRSRRKSGKGKTGQDESQEPNEHGEHPCDGSCRQSKKMLLDVLA